MPADIQCEAGVAENHGSGAGPRFLSRDSGQRDDHLHSSIPNGARNAMRERAAGQVLPLFAILLIGMFALAALAIDVSGTYAARQAYRTAADAAALAGAQDLQVANSRGVTPAQYTKARQDAQASLQGQFGDPATCAAPVGNRSDCTFATIPFQARSSLRCRQAPARAATSIGPSRSTSSTRIIRSRSHMR